jgi:citrate synthase
MGRVVRCLAFLLQHEDALEPEAPEEPFAGLLTRALMGRPGVSPAQARMLEALAVAAVDHGVTPPSVQAVRLAASVRAPLECALAAGLCTISRVHGGAGMEAAELFLRAVGAARASGREPARVLEDLWADRVRAGEKIPGLGHRIHDEDPRVPALWALADETDTAGDCVRCSKMASEIFSRIAGRPLPVNVDGAIGAVIADMGLPPELAEGVFLLGRVAGLAAHYFEEVSAFPEMRWVPFSEVRYEGPSSRSLDAGEGAETG